MELREAINKLNEFKNIELYFNCSYFTSGKVKLDDKDKEAIDTVIRELIIKNKMVEYILSDNEENYDTNKEELYNEYYKLGDYYYLQHENTGFNFF